MGMGEHEVAWVSRSGLPRARTWYPQRAAEKGPKQPPLPLRPRFIFVVSPSGADLSSSAHRGRPITSCRSVSSCSRVSRLMSRIAVTTLRLTPRWTR
jgi:hypothetical protein